MFRLPIFCLNCALLTVVFLAAGSHAAASIITQPLDLNEGDQYRLAFVTSNGTNAIPDGVGYYNNFVNNAANLVDELADLNTDWRAIVSSTTFGANENTDTRTNSIFQVPIYGLDGLRIADNYVDLWDDSIDSPINRTELGTISSFFVWTGSLSDGTPSVTFRLDGTIANDVSINGPNATVGFPGLGRNWITASFFNVNSVLSVYGMSGVLAAQAVPVPEPSSLVCLGGLLTLAGWRRSRRRFRRGAGCRTAAHSMTGGASEPHLIARSV